MIYFEGNLWERDWDGSGGGTLLREGHVKRLEGYVGSYVG